MPQFLPFHESVVRAIKRSRSKEELVGIFRLIMTTKIPDGHDEIISAIDTRSGELGLPTRNGFVMDSLLLQRRAAQERTREYEQAASAPDGERCCP